MKKKIKRLIFTSLIVLMMMSTLNLPQISFAKGKTKVNVIVKGELLNIKEGLIIKEDRIYIPIRYLAEALDFKVEWMEKERIVKVSKVESEILIPVGKNEVFIEKERAYMPLRKLAERLSEKVEWDKRNKIAIVGDFMDKEDSLELGENYKKIKQYMKKESIAAFSPYYELLDFEISNYKEKEVNGNTEATFHYKIIEKNYDKDPDTVEYIKKLKESGHRDYQQLYDEYLEPRESNFDLKIIIDKNDKMNLYSNEAPKGVQWEKIEMTDYILN